MKTIAPMNIKIHWINVRLPTHVPRRNFAHHPLDGGYPIDSHGRSSPKGSPCRGPPFNPLVELFGWLTLDPHMIH